jgi:hypothetical protein
VAKDKDTKSLKELAKSNVEQEDLKGILEEIQHTSDRTAAIVLASCIRNAFAHSVVQLTLETPQVAAEIEKLRLRSGVETPPELMKMSEQRRKYTIVCSMFAVIARLRGIGMKMDIMLRVMNAVSPHVAEDKRIKPEQLEQYSKAAEGIKELKID